MGWREARDRALLLGSAPLATCQIEQLFHFEQQTTGVGLQLESMFQLGGASHLLTYGIDIMRQRVETKRDGRVLNVNTGAVTYGLAGETYPLRDFANGVTDRRRRSPEAVRSETRPSVITLPLLKMATRSQTR